MAVNGSGSADATTIEMHLLGAGLAVSNTAQSLRFRLPGDDVLLVAAFDGRAARSSLSAGENSQSRSDHSYSMTIETCDIALSY